MYYAWLFLGGVALIFGLINPIMIDLQPRWDVTVAGLLVGGAAVAGGLLRRARLLLWAGAAVLWVVIVAGTASQIAPLGLAPGVTWGPRGLLLAAAALGWILFLRPPPWLLRGALAIAVPTIITLALLWITAPAYPRNAIFYWLAADSRGTVYANDPDNGSIWVFDANGGIRGKLWPRRVAPGTPGPGLQPAGLGSELTAALVRATPTPGGLSEREFSFCGLAVDPQDQLYVVDPDLAQVRRFDRDGQLRGAWALPSTFIAARGCLAADGERVYVGDNHGIIYVYDHAGAQQAEWRRDQVPLGLAVLPNGQLLVLEQARVVALAAPQGTTVREWPLPPPPPQAQVPYQAIVTRGADDLFVTDLYTNRILHYGPGGQALPPLGMPGGWPGQFGRLGGMTLDAQGRLYVSDPIYRVIQRFRPDGQVDAVWSAPEDETTEQY